MTAAGSDGTGSGVRSSERALGTVPTASRSTTAPRGAAASETALPGEGWGPSAWPPLPLPGATPTPGCARPARASPAGTQDRRGPPGSPSLAGRAVLCVPWRTLAGWSSEPGELSRIGPVTAGVARDLALAAAADVTCQWKVIVVGRSGRAVAVAKVRRTRAGARARSGGPASAAAGGSDGAGVVGRITLTIPVGLLHRTAGPDRGGTGLVRPIRGGSRGGHAGRGEGVLRPPVRDRIWWLHPRGGEPRLPGSGHDARARRGARSDMRVPHLPSACLAVRAGPHDRPPPGRPDLPVQPVS